MHFSKILPFLIIFVFLYQTGVAQITQGTISFKQEFSIDWTIVENKLMEELNEIEASKKSAEEKELGKAQWKDLVDNMRAMLKQQQTLAANDSATYIFTKNQAVAQIIERGKLRDEFWAYNLDSMQVSLYSIDGDKVNKKVISAAAETNFINVRDSVVVDKNDQKNILGFQCVKYDLYHSYDVKFTNHKESEHYEMYVTDAIKFPFFIMTNTSNSPVFDGCALEIKRIELEPEAYQIVMKATSFSRQVDTSKFVLPEKFKE